MDKLTKWKICQKIEDLLFGFGLLGCGVALTSLYYTPINSFPDNIFWLGAICALASLFPAIILMSAREGAGFMSVIVELRKRRKSEK